MNSGTRLASISAAETNIPLILLSPMNTIGNKDGTGIADVVPIRDPQLDFSIPVWMRRRQSKMRISQLIMKPGLMTVAFGAVFAFAPTEASAQSQCVRATQNRIAWDYKGGKKWAQGNLDRLCKNSRNAAPANCFRRVMHGNVNYGGGIKWKWQNAIDLCEQSRNANRTINCFKKNISRGDNWKAAIAKCDERMPMPDCRASTQNKIAWDYKGSKKWVKSNLDRLCKGAEDDEPAKCFKRVMHNKVNYGGGDQWKWQNAIDLCEGSPDADGTIRCFKKQIRSGKGWKAAIARCGR